MAPGRVRSPFWLPSALTHVDFRSIDWERTWHREELVRHKIKENSKRKTKCILENMRKTAEKKCFMSYRRRVLCRKFPSSSEILIKSASIYSCLI